MRSLCRLGDTFKLTCGFGGAVSVWVVAVSAAAFYILHAFYWLKFMTRQLPTFKVMFKEIILPVQGFKQPVLIESLVQSRCSTRIVHEGCLMRCNLTQVFPIPRQTPVRHLSPGPRNPHPHLRRPFQVTCSHPGRKLQPCPTHKSMAHGGGD